MDIHEWLCRIKSARRKRRLVKTDFDKRLIKLSKTREQLWQQKQNLPMVPLEHPYQRGWKRFFVLRDDVKRGPQAGFYEALLVKINTVEYHHDRSFKRKKRRRGRKVYVVKQQLLREFYAYGWEANRMNLSDDEKACFTRVETFDIKTRCTDVKYVVTEPWRFVLKVMPHMVTHVKLHDELLQQEIATVNNHIEKHF
ncbi:MAG: hypothetical protein WC615_21455, partial [Mucilaginibacter sp.]|uniref:hypothetical protein n=1 Tax=Mucilaginibacter sp. TaxID=1882438 RepID=UPI003564A52F